MFHRISEKMINFFADTMRISAVLNIQDSGLVVTQIFLYFPLSLFGMECFGSSNNIRWGLPPSLPIFNSPCRLLQNNGVLKSVSTPPPRQWALPKGKFTADHDFASTGGLDPGRTISDY